MFELLTGVGDAGVGEFSCSRKRLRDAGIGEAESSTKMSPSRSSAPFAGLPEEPGLYCGCRVVESDTDRDCPVGRRESGDARLRGEAPSISILKGEPSTSFRL